jgi:hypothetical protein
MAAPRNLPDLVNFADGLQRAATEAALLINHPLIDLAPFVEQIQQRLEVSLAQDREARRLDLAREQEARRVELAREQEARRVERVREQEARRAERALERAAYRADQLAFEQRMLGEMAVLRQGMEGLQQEMVALRQDVALSEGRSTARLINSRLPTFQYPLNHLLTRNGVLPRHFPPTASAIHEMRIQQLRETLADYDLAIDGDKVTLQSRLGLFLGLSH